MATNDLNLTVRQLRAFVVMADLGSQKRAAEKINVAQATLGEYLDSVSAYFGGGLLECHPRFRLLPRGVQILPDVRRLLARLEGLRDSSAIVRVGFNRAARPLVERALCSLGPHQQRGFDVELSERTSASLADQLHTGELDVCICYALRGKFHSADKVRRVDITTQAIALVTPAGAWQRKRLDPRALTELAYVHVPRSFSDSLLEHQEHWLGHCKLNPRRRIECAYATEIIAYASSGCGYGFLPALWSMTPHAGAVFTPVKGFAFRATISAYFRSRREPILQPLLAALADAAKAGLHGFDSGKRQKKRPSSRSTRI